MNQSRDEMHPAQLSVMRRSGLVLAMAAFVAVLLAASPVSGAPLNAEADESARAGAAWLSSQLEAQIPLEQFGSVDWGVTLEAASALAAVDVTNPLLEEVWNAVVANREEIVAKDGDDIPGSLAKVILLAHSIEKDPTAVGSGAEADLVRRLTDTLQSNGLFGTQFPNYDGVYRQGLALAALAAAGETSDRSAIDWLIAQQCTNAGFEGAYMSYRADTSVDCYDDPDAWEGADTNATALAITGLTNAAKGDSPADDAVVLSLAWLEGAQDSDGGWASNSWSEPDPNSTAVIVQALIARGALGEPGFNGKTESPVAALMSFQLGDDASEAERGAFSFPAAGPGPNLLASVQAVQAVAGQPLVFVGSSSEEPPASTTTTTTTTTTAPVTTSTVPASTAGVPTGSISAPSTYGTGNSQVAGRTISFAG